MDRLGPVASLDPAARLLCLALLSSASLAARPSFSAVVAATAVLLLKMAGLSFARILRDSAFVAVFLLFAAALRYFDFSLRGIDLPAAAGYIGAYGARLLAAFLAGRLFYASTSLSELRDATTRITRRLPLLRRADMGLPLSMVIGFIPLILAEWSASLEAARSRGMPRRAGLAKQSLFLGAFLRRLMLRAVATPEALIARGWTKDRGIALSKWRKRDSLSLLACMCALGAALLRIV